MRLRPLLHNRRAQLAAGLIAAIGLGYGAYLALRPYDLRRDDPDGWQSCATLAYWLDGKARDLQGRPMTIDIPAEVAGDHGHLADQPTIRAAVRRDGQGRWIANPEQLWNACTALGYPMPEYHTDIR